MTNNYSRYFKELKVGLFSDYPSFSDVTSTHWNDLIPWFDVQFNDGQRKAFAVVKYYDAYLIPKYKNLIYNIRHINSIEEDDYSGIVFEAIAPAITAWVKEKNYLSSSRTLTFLFCAIIENEGSNLSHLAEGMASHLNEEYKESMNSDTRRSLLLSIKNLEQFIN